MRTNTLKPFSILFFYLLIFPVFLFSNNFESQGKCIAGPLRIRSTPDLSGQILGRLQMGDEFAVLGRTSYKETIGSDRAFWYKITYQNMTGYVFGSFIEISDEYYDDIWVEKLFFDNRDPVYNTHVTIKNSELTFFDTDKKKKISGGAVLLRYDLENRKFLMKNEESEYGWIDMDTTEFRDYEDDMAEAPDYFTHNPYRTAAKKEYDLIQDHKGLVRNGPMVSFSNEEGYIEFFNHNYVEFSTRHNIIDIILDKYVMVYSHYYESYEYRIFDLSDSDKEKYSTSSSPHYSPDENLFFCGSNDDLAGYYGFDLFSIADGELTLLLSHELSPFSSSYSETQIVSQKWVGNDEVILESEGGLKYRVTKTESEWQFKKSGSL